MGGGSWEVGFGAEESRKKDPGLGSSGFCPRQAGRGLSSVTHLWTPLAGPAAFDRPSMDLTVGVGRVVRWTGAALELVEFAPDVSPQDPALMPPQNRELSVNLVVVACKSGFVEPNP